jgi:DNA (cytosine-5)-methyltransferase 1
MKDKKILNLYAGLGGNRKKWSGDIKVTAIEFDPDIASFYHDQYPEDDLK